MKWYERSFPLAEFAPDHAVCSAAGSKLMGSPEYSCQGIAADGSVHVTAALFIVEPGGRLGRVTGGGEAGSRPKSPQEAASRMQSTFNPGNNSTISCTPGQRTAYGAITGPGLFQCEVGDPSGAGAPLSVVVDWNADGTLAEVQPGGGGPTSGNTGSGASSSNAESSGSSTNSGTTGAQLTDNSTCSDWNNASTAAQDSYGATLAPPRGLSSSGFLNLVDTECKGFAADPSLASTTSLATIVQQLGGQSGGTGATASSTAASTAAPSEACPTKVTYIVGLRATGVDCSTADRIAQVASTQPGCTSGTNHPGDLSSCTTSGYACQGLVPNSASTIKGDDLTCTAAGRKISFEVGP